MADETLDALLEQMQQQAVRAQEAADNLRALDDAAEARAQEQQLEERRQQVRTDFREDDYITKYAEATVAGEKGQQNRVRVEVRSHVDQGVAIGEGVQITVKVDDNLDGTFDRQHHVAIDSSLIGLNVPQDLIVNLAQSITGFQDDRLTSFEAKDILDRTIAASEAIALAR